MIRSEGEKDLMKHFIKPAKKLDFELKTHHDEAFGDEEYYEIPEDRYEEILTALYPFEDMPKMDEIIWDIHENAPTSLRKSFIIRWEDYNFIVSEHYFKSGGTILDFIPITEKDINEGVATKTIKK